MSPIRPALTLFSQGKITLSNVEVTNSLSGTDLNASGNVSLQNSKFNNNKKFGASINSGGNVQITNSQFNNNTSSKYDAFGLEVDSLGSVTLMQVIASNNEKFGAAVNASGQVTVLSGAFSGNVSYSYTNCGKSSSNGGYGLEVVSNDSIFLNDVSATDNYLFGAHLEGTDVAIVDGTFSNNGSGSSQHLTGKGLEIDSTANVSLVNVEANNNQLFGANIQAEGNVNITNGFFNGHKVYTYGCKGKSSVAGGGYGLQIVTDGAISLLQCGSLGQLSLWRSFDRIRCGPDQRLLRQ